MEIIEYEEKNLLKAANEFVEKNSGMTDGTYRPKYHMTPPIGWINDPNGFCIYKGKYHLFYQYFPYSPNNTKMYWAHSESDDLIKWDFKGTAVAPDMEYDREGVFSGTALVKGDNLTLMYTGVSRNKNHELRQTQCLAYSGDGIAFKKEEQNPVIKTEQLPENCNPDDFRDPKVWEKNGIYYCLVITVCKNYSKLLLYKSKNLINWEFHSVMLSGEGMNLGTLWECPDLFELDGKDIVVISTANVKPRKNKFTHGNETVYFIGKLDYDNGIFTYEFYDQLDDGSDFYAPQTIKDINGRCIMTAWQSCWGRNNPTAELGHGWAGNMTLPREINLLNSCLVQTPVREIENYLIKKASYNDAVLKAGEERIFPDINGDCLKLEIEADITLSAKFYLRLLSSGDEYVEVYFEKASGLLTFNRSNSEYRIYGVEMQKGASMATSSYIGENVNFLKFNVFLDKSAIEIFINNNNRCLTSKAFMKKQGKEIIFKADGDVILNITQYDFI